jgi:TPR repeat protein
MQRLVTHSRTVAPPKLFPNLAHKFLACGLFLLLWLAAQPAAAATEVARPADSSWQDPALLGILGSVERAFLDGVRAYEKGDHTRATKLWREPAEYGHPLAQFNLGVAYATGQGIDANIAHAARWWQAAAYQGHTEAQYNLGLLYSRGQGVEKSISKARMWWYMAAMSGDDPAAQYHLGFLAATGHGEKQDFTEAAWWWVRSADQGYEHAVKGLELLKQHGSLEVSRK